MHVRLRVDDTLVIRAIEASYMPTFCPRAQEGASTVVAEINLSGAQQCVSRITSAGQVTAAVAVYLGDEHAVAAMIEFAVDRFGV